MLDEETLRAAIGRLIAAATAPSRVILFGSYARGTADEASDVDILVVERDVPDPAGEYMRLRDALGRVAPGVGVDLLLCGEDDYVRRSQVPGHVFHRARTEGKVFHDALH
jgi:predicted nucleotidyltransferase